MRLQKHNLLLSFILSLVILFASLVILPVSVYAITVYTNGYFRYTVDDMSVTIISYKGTESEVTVPNMIAGNPVNVIAKGAFARNKDVTTIHLPDTIMSVEEGAFNEDQTVIYDFDNNATDDGGGLLDDEPDDITEPVDTGDNGGNGDTGEDNGNAADNGNGSDEAETGQLIVDEEGNLILVSVDGYETVLDGNGDYTVKKDENGKDIVLDPKGNEIRIDPDGRVVFADGEDNKVTVDTKTGNKIVESADGDYGYEEVQIDDGPVPDGDEGKDPEHKGSGSLTGDGEKTAAEDDEAAGDRAENTGVIKAASDNAHVITAVIIVAAVLLVLYIVVFRQKKE